MDETSKIQSVIPLTLATEVTRRHKLGSGTLTQLIDYFSQRVQVEDAIASAIEKKSSSEKHILRSSTTNSSKVTEIPELGGLASTLQKESDDQVKWHLHLAERINLEIVRPLKSFMTEGPWATATKIESMIRQMAEEMSSRYENISKQYSRNATSKHNSNGMSKLDEEKRQLIQLQSGWQSDIVPMVEDFEAADVARIETIRDVLFRFEHYRSEFFKRGIDSVTPVSDIAQSIRPQPRIVDSLPNEPQETAPRVPLSSPNTPTVAAKNVPVIPSSVDGGDFNNQQVPKSPTTSTGTALTNPPMQMDVSEAHKRSGSRSSHSMSMISAHSHQNDDSAASLKAPRGLRRLNFFSKLGLGRNKESNKPTNDNKDMHIDDPNTDPGMYPHQPVASSVVPSQMSGKSSGPPEGQSYQPSRKSSISEESGAAIVPIKGPSTDEHYRNAMVPGHTKVAASDSGKEFADWVYDDNAPPALQIDNSKKPPAVPPRSAFTPTVNSNSRNAGVVQQIGQSVPRSPTDNLPTINRAIPDIIPPKDSESYAHSDTSSLSVQPSTPNTVAVTRRERPKTTVFGLSDAPSPSLSRNANTISNAGFPSGTDGENALENNKNGNSDDDDDDNGDMGDQSFKVKFSIRDQAIQDSPDESKAAISRVTNMLRTNSTMRGRGSRRNARATPGRSGMSNDAFYTMFVPQPEKRPNADGDASPNLFGQEDGDTGVSGQNTSDAANPTSPTPIMSSPETPRSSGILTGIQANEPVNTNPPRVTGAIRTPNGRSVGQVHPEETDPESTGSTPFASPVERSVPTISNTAKPVNSAGNTASVATGATTAAALAAGIGALQSTKKPEPAIDDSLSDDSFDEDLPSDNSSDDFISTKSESISLPDHNNGRTRPQAAKGVISGCEPSGEEMKAPYDSSYSSLDEGENASESDILLDAIEAKKNVDVPDAHASHGPVTRSAKINYPVTDGSDDVSNGLVDGDSGPVSPGDVEGISPATRDTRAAGLDNDSSNDAPGYAVYSSANPAPESQLVSVFDETRSLESGPASPVPKASSANLFNASVSVPSVSASPDIDAPSANLPDSNISVPSVSVSPVGAPSATIPGANVSVPSVSASPDIDAPSANLPDSNISVPSVSVSPVGAPSATIPGANVSVPSVSASPDIDAPSANLPDSNISVPSVSASPEIDAPSVNLPNANVSVPSVSASPDIDAPSANLPDSNISVPSVSASPEIDAPSVNLPNANVSVPSVSASPEIDAPSVNLPNANVSVPSVSASPDIDAPSANLPDSNISVPSVSASPEIDAPSVNLPNANVSVPSVSASPDIDAPSANLPDSNISVPSVSASPEIDAPSVNLPNANVSVPSASASPEFVSPLVTRSGITASIGSTSVNPVPGMPLTISPKVEATISSASVSPALNSSSISTPNITESVSTESVSPDLVIPSVTEPVISGAIESSTTNSTPELPSADTPDISASVVSDSMGPDLVSRLGPVPKTKAFIASSSTNPDTELSPEPIPEITDSPLSAYDSPPRKLSTDPKQGASVSTGSALVSPDAEVSLVNTPDVDVYAESTSVSPALNSPSAATPRITDSIGSSSVSPNPELRSAITSEVVNPIRPASMSPTPESLPDTSPGITPLTKSTLAGSSPELPSAEIPEAAMPTSPPSEQIKSTRTVVSNAPNGEATTAGAPKTPASIGDTASTGPDVSVGSSTSLALHSEPRDSPDQQANTQTPSRGHLAGMPGLAAGHSARRRAPPPPPPPGSRARSVRGKSKSVSEPNSSADNEHVSSDPSYGRTNQGSPNAFGITMADDQRPTEPVTANKNDVRSSPLSDTNPTKDIDSHSTSDEQPGDTPADNRRAIEAADLQDSIAGSAEQKPVEASGESPNVTTRSFQDTESNALPQIKRQSSVRASHRGRRVDSNGPLPVSMAVRETLNYDAYGSDATLVVKAKIVGEIILQVQNSIDPLELAPLRLCVRKPEGAQWAANPAVVTLDSSLTNTLQDGFEWYRFVRPNLFESAAQGINATVFKYQVASEDPSLLPILVHSEYMVADDSSSFMLFYGPNGDSKFAGDLITGSAVLLKLNGEVVSLASRPAATWYPLKNSLLWKLDDIEVPEDQLPVVVGEGFNSKQILAVKYRAVGNAAPGPIALRFESNNARLVDIDVVMARVVSSGKTAVVSTGPIARSTRSGRCTHIFRFKPSEDEFGSFSGNLREVPNPQPPEAIKDVENANWNPKVSPITEYYQSVPDIDAVAKNAR